MNAGYWRQMVPKKKMCISEPRYFFYIALFAWLIIFAGLLKMLVQSLFSGFYRSNF